MKILMVNKFFYIKGGSETYYFSLKKLLEQHGHEVIDFSMQDERNFESEYSSYFVDNVDYNKSQGIIKKAKLAKNIIYSKEASMKLEKLLQATKPDIAHLHIFQHQLSPSILDVLKKYHIPIVYTAHDLKMLCPNYRMFSNQTVCEKCKNRKYWNCTKYKCIKDSKMKSMIGSLEAYFHLYRKSYDKIDKIITPSLFFKNKFIEFGVEENRVVHIPNFLMENDIEFHKKDDTYFLYFGRLSEEKGIFTLLEAMKDIKIPLYIVGTGPKKEEIQKMIEEKHLDNIRLLGFQSGQELTDYIASAKAVIVPSEWYENGPYSIIEALRLGRPIIGSDLGGIPEAIDNGKNGYIFSNKDINELHKYLLQFEKMDEAQYHSMEESARNKFLQNYTAEKHYQEIMKIYTDLYNFVNPTKGE